MQLDDSLKKFGLCFTDLCKVPALQSLDTYFVDQLDSTLRQQLLRYRKDGRAFTAEQSSELLLALATPLENLLAEMFSLQNELEQARATVARERRIFAFKRTFVLRHARRYRKPIAHSFEALDRWLQDHIATTKGTDLELSVADFALATLDQKDPQTIEKLTQWCVLALQNPTLRVPGWSSFILPKNTQYAQLVTLEKVPNEHFGRTQAPAQRLRPRDGFDLTDLRKSAREVQAEIEYCIYCHDKKGDFCSRGFPERKGQPELGLKLNPLGELLTGCPLEERISEMNLLKRDGFNLGALAMAMADNPMIPATGHRICNDCMKSCIYQKQDPVDIPQIETRVLTDVLQLPWGVEIYDLLTRWNPLRRKQYLPKAYNGRKVLVAGLGPAGFSMAHHLTMEGCAVVGIDGLKLEPLPERLIQAPVRDYQSLSEALGERINSGFGGVAEYGITVRWDKNFLRLIYLNLLRRPLFQAFGGVRFGGTITLDNAWALGFQHVCIATGAGRPRVIPMGNSLARGMRQANDFLMALQLTGAAKESSLATLQVRLPAVVIGGGLTAIDTATEVQAYYIQQVEKTLRRYEILSQEQGQGYVETGLNEEDQIILTEFLHHGHAIRKERENAAKLGQAPNFISLLRAWGGVTIAYRRGMNASPAYLRNHEEIIQAMEEGLYYAEGLDPVHVHLDRFKHVESIRFRRMKSDQGRWLATHKEVSLPAKAIFVAAGAAPNTLYEDEYPGTFRMDGDQYRPCVSHRGCQQPVAQAQHCKESGFGPFTTYQNQGRRVSFLGDTHPVFHGSVVKAIASAKRSYPQVMQALYMLSPEKEDLADYQAFRQRLASLLQARVASRKNRGTQVIELWVKAPMAARNFRPGQFYRLQTYEHHSPIVAGTRLQVPLLTVSGTGVKDDCIRLLLFRGAATTRLIERLQKGDPIVVMGPTGEATNLGQNKTILIIAGQWGAAVMLGLGPALRAVGNRVIYLAGYRQAKDILYREELEAATDQIIWSLAQGPTFEPTRPNDCVVHHPNMIEVLRRYGTGELTPKTPGIPLEKVHSLYVMGATGLLQAIQGALREVLQPLFSTELETFATVGSPMQCMLKGVCGQCLQWQIDPNTGQRTRAVFSCAMQDQPLDWIDLDNLSARIAQNRLPEHLTSLWLRHLADQGLLENQQSA